MIERDYIEKRDFIRMRINTQANVSVEEKGIKTSAVCNDLSGNGMLLTIDQKLPIGSELTVTLRAKESEGPTLTAKCVIVRQQPGSSKDKYLIGLEILEIIDDEEYCQEAEQTLI